MPCKLVGLADMPGIGFRHLDGCNMDDEFAFDIYRETQEERDQEQRDYAEMSRRFEERQEEKKRLEVGEGWQEPAEDSIWKRSVQIDDFENFPLGLRIFSIGCDLADLIVDIRDGVPREQVGPESQAHIERTTIGDTGLAMTSRSSSPITLPTRGDSSLAIQSPPPLPESRRAD